MVTNLQLDPNSPPAAVASPTPAAVPTSADLVIGLPAGIGTNSLGEFIARLDIPAPLTAAVLAPAASASRESSSALQFEASSRNIHIFSYALPPDSTTPLPGVASAAALIALFSLAVSLNAHSCTTLGPDCAALPTASLRLLTTAAFDDAYALVMPVYSMGPYDGLLNTAILYPVTRALFGRRVHHPLSSDFQISRALLARLAARNPSAPLLWPSIEAAMANYPIAEAHLGIPRSQSPSNLDLPALLAATAGPLFAEMDRSAAFWQRLRGSHEVAQFGAPAAHAANGSPIDTQPMLDAFQRGAGNLAEIWQLVLPPVSLLALHKLARTPAAGFRMPDSLWARIVYDFALAHRVRTINHSHLFGALTPLYLGWAAGYVADIAANPLPDAVAARAETLARAFEAEKPYLLQRWRWPDRFSP